MQPTHRDGASGPTAAGPATRRDTALLLLLFFASGAAALIYEVLWLKELGRLFGVTAHAAATTLAVFFAGLSTGAWVWGRRSARMAAPLRTYALLEFAVAGSAVAYFFILALYRVLFPWVSGALADWPALLPAAKLALAAGVLFPPAFFMGGTLPVMGRHMIRRADRLGLGASLLYGVNTVGAALGAFLAGFYLPVSLGFRDAYLVAIGLNVAIGCTALIWSATARSPVGSEPAAAPRGPVAPPAGARPVLVLTVAAASGFATLGLEVLWVRMYAQVLQNSVYTFAAILTVFLAALALGSFVSNLLCRLRLSPFTVLFGLLTVSGFLVGFTPLLFYRLTSGLRYVGGQAGWADYIVDVFGHTTAVLLVPGIAIGSIFPYLMKLAERWADSPGKTIGQLASLNTAAAITGSLCAGFVMLETVGLWTAMRIMALIYLALAVVALPSGKSFRLPLRLVPACGILLFGLVVTYSDYGTVHVNAAADEEVLETWEGSLGTVAVIRQGDDLRVKFNNYYTVGGSNSATLHRRQAWIPLSLHPGPRSAFFLGMGTGISAGAALDFPLERVVVAELSGELIAASRNHFGPYTNGLFDDPRVELLRQDGRNYLFASHDEFDVIVADLFLTWKAGVGSLYTREHFETVRRRLASGGLFVQWLPLAQLTGDELGTIARTMLDVFPQITVWRRGFSLQTPALALVGQSDVAPLDDASFKRHMAELVRAGKIPPNAWITRIPHALYAGNLNAASALFSGYPVNTDDRPLVEYLAPIHNRDAMTRDSRSMTGDELGRFYRQLLEHRPPAEDPYLAELDDREVDQVLAGYELYEYLVARRAASAAAAGHLRRFEQLSGVRLGPRESSGGADE